jgi:AcrR family transcriptional regulator
MSAAREKMIAATAYLLSSEGLEGTSFATVLTQSGAPRGSIYHHFPEGKDQLVLEAVGVVGDGVLARIRAMEAATPDEVVKSFTNPWRDLLMNSQCQAGCAVAAVVRNEREAAASIFASWAKELSARLTAAGMNSALADRSAQTVVAATEGALLVAQADGDIDAFDRVVEDLVELVNMRSGFGAGA